MNSNYQRALRQITALITHFCNRNDTGCAIAEQQDLILTRLDSLQHTLRPDDTQAIDTINQYSRRHIHDEHNH